MNCWISQLIPRAPQAAATGGNRLSARALAVAGTGTRQSRGGYRMRHHINPPTRMHEGLQHLVNAGLVAGAEATEKAENVGVEPQADSQLRFPHIEYQIGCPSGPRRLGHSPDSLGRLRGRCTRTRFGCRGTCLGLCSYVTAL